MKSANKISDLPKDNALTKSVPQTRPTDPKTEKPPEPIDKDAEKKKRRPMLNPDSRHHSNLLPLLPIAPASSCANTLSNYSPPSVDTGAISILVSNQEMDISNQLKRTVLPELNVKTDVYVSDITSRNSSSLFVSDSTREALRHSSTGLDSLSSQTSAARIIMDKGRRPSLTPQDGIGLINRGVNYERRRSIASSDLPKEKEVGYMIKERRPSISDAPGIYNLANMMSRHSVGVPYTDAGYRLISDIQNREINKSMILEERSISDRKKQEILIKEAGEMIKKPSRLLPSDMMEKYKIRASKADSPTDSSVINSNQNNNSEFSLSETLSEKQENKTPKTKSINKYRNLWNLAICYTLVGIRFKNLYEDLRAKSMNIQRAKALEAEGLSVLLSSNISKGDPVVSARVKNSLITILDPGTNE